MGAEGSRDGQYFRIEVRTVDDLRRRMGPSTTRPEAEAMWELLGDAGMLHDAGSSQVTGLMTHAEWRRWCDRAWRTARSAASRRAPSSPAPMQIAS